MVLRRGAVLTILAVSAGKAGGIKVECTETSTCESTLRPGSVCRADGTCSNPFGSGCLRARLGPESFPSRRACSSDDPPDAAALGLCDDPPFDSYPEVRIQSQDWDNPMFSAWAMQILLSELLGVPTTVESSDPDRRFNFYDPDGREDSSAATYPYDELRRAADLREAGNDCRKVKGEGGEYVPCSQVLPMVNKVGQADAVQRLIDDGIISQPKDSGTLDQYRWWMPKIHAKKNPNLLSYFGMSEKSARPKVAALFGRPTDWGTYCELVSQDGCAAKDEVAARAPKNDDEAGKYFAEGLYAGHFRATEKNDCEADPNGCTGHIANVPCEWGNYAVAQAHHLGIPVESDGDLEPNGGYSYSSILEVYSAANATQSNVIMYWWEPDSLIESYRGTDYEFVPIYLPQPTKECVNNRVSKDDRCSANFEDQVGSPEGACDAGAVPNQMLMTLDECGRSDDGSCSPAYAALRGYEMTNLDLQQLFQYRIADLNNDRREATCRWFAENLENIKETFIPRTFPRQPRKQEFYQPVTYFTLAIGVLSTICVFLCAVGSKKFEKTRPMVHAQVDFLLLILSGLFLVTVGAILYSLPPSKGVCVSRQWLYTVGYSLELIPLAVKVAAINKIFHQSKKMKKVNMKKRDLYKVVGGCIVLLFVYLATWTGVDPPIPRTKMTLTDETENDNYIVEVSTFCASSNRAWQIVTTIYLAVLLLISAAIATQNRTIRQEFNESRYMALMIYSHLMFIVLRVMVFIISDKLANTSTVSSIISLLLSMDTLITIGIYFLPKLIAAEKSTREAQQTAGSRAPIVCRRDSMENSDPKSFTWRVSSRHSVTQPASDYDSEDQSFFENDTGDTGRASFLGNVTEQGINNTGGGGPSRRRVSFSLDTSPIRLGDGDEVIESEEVAEVPEDSCLLEVSKPSMDEDKRKGNLEKSGLGLGLGLGLRNLGHPTC